MASIHKQVLIDVAPEDAWDALRDWAVPHERLAPGFVSDTRIDGDVRIVTFISGNVARERFIASDDDERRLVWSVVDGPLAHHNSSAQVFSDDGGTTRFVWITDVLPDEVALRFDELMERGIAVIKQTLESAPPGD